MDSELTCWKINILRFYRWTGPPYNNKQLLDEAAHIQNYPDRGQCYLPKAEADSIDRGLDNS